MADAPKQDLTEGGKKPWFYVNRRATLTYRESLSNRFVFVAAFGAMFVLLDPRLIIPLGDGVMLKLGGDGFSLDLKGLVIGAILIEGYKAIKEYWFGSTAAGQKTSEVVERMAESAAPAAAAATVAAVAAATGNPAPPPAVPPVTPGPTLPDGSTPAATADKLSSDSQPPKGTT